MLKQSTEVFSTGAAARVLGVSQQTVHVWLRRGDLKAERTPLGFLLPRADVERLAKQRRVAAAG